MFLGIFALSFYIVRKIHPTVVFIYGATVVYTLNRIYPEQCQSTMPKAKAKHTRGPAQLPTATKQIEESEEDSSQDSVQARTKDCCCSKKVFKRRRMEKECSSEEEIIQTVPKRPRKPSFVVTSREMKAYFRLLEDPLIYDFIQADVCKLISDKFLLAMVFAYFKRAAFNIRHFSRMNFFVALYLACDMEEDEEENKYEIFPWALGRSWKNKYIKFLQNRDKLWARIGYRAVVSSKCCEEIMAIEQDHWAWQRTRPIHHGGATRTYGDEGSEDWFPRGPDASPKVCKQCGVPTREYDSASPDNTTWYLSSSTESSPDLTGHNGHHKNLRFTVANEQHFNMKGLQNTLHNDEGIWACRNEP